MRIGIIGGGVVGRATARTYIGWQGTEVAVWDVVPERRTVPSHHDACACDVVFVCLPETELDKFFGQSDVSPSRVNYVIRSTCPIGTTRRLATEYGLRNVVHSPEFLTERCAQLDAMTPARNIVGIPGPDGGGTVLDLYRARFPHVPVRVMTSDESEAVKLFTNGFYAVKVAYWNEVRALADKLGLDWDRVIGGVLSGGTIHPLHTQVPGPDGRRGFGGRCIPKDLETLIDLQTDMAFKTGGSSSPVWPAVTQATLTRNQNYDRKEGGVQ